MSRYTLWIEIQSDRPLDLSLLSGLAGITATDHGSKGDLVAKRTGGMRPRLFSRWLYETEPIETGTSIRGLEPLVELLESTTRELVADVQRLGAEIAIGMDLIEDGERDRGNAVSVSLSLADLRFVESLQASFVLNALPRRQITPPRQP